MVGESALRLVAADLPARDGDLGAELFRLPLLWIIRRGKHMNRKHGAWVYATRAVANRELGWAGLELYREAKGQHECGGRVIFWDASGQFSLQTFGEIPLDVAEELIREAKQTIKTK